VQVITVGEMENIQLNQWLERLLDTNAKVGTLPAIHIPSPQR
jgi:hypothetical protein